MHRANTIEPPPRQGAVSPWVEISAWILAFGILLAAQCAPERSTNVAAERTETAAAPVSAVSGRPGAPRPPR
jgi:hypothetical protein